MAGEAIAADRIARAGQERKPFAWRWAQQWRETTFLHWRVPAELFQPHLHADVEVDVYDGAAWISLVYFRLRTRPRAAPWLPGVSSLLELNVRTYVRRRDCSGIWFLSMHATNRLAIAIARCMTPLPYEHARMAYSRRPYGYECHCTIQTDPKQMLHAEVEPTGDLTAARAGNLDAWLLERYRLYIPNRRGRLLNAEVMHPPWLAQPCNARIIANTLGERFGVDISGPPDAAHYSPGVEAKFGRFLPVEDSNRPQPR